MPRLENNAQPPALLVNCLHLLSMVVHLSSCLMRADTSNPPLGAFTRSNSKTSCLLIDDRSCQARGLDGANPKVVAQIDTVRQLQFKYAFHTLRSSHSKPCYKSLQRMAWACERLFFCFQQISAEVRRQVNKARRIGTQERRWHYASPLLLPVARIWKDPKWSAPPMTASAHGPMSSKSVKMLSSCCRSGHAAVRCER